jgi:putative ABC transport system permease protein
MAVGAQRSDILKLVVRNGMLLTLAGLAMGMAVGLLLTQVMSGMLFGISATDPLVFTLGPLALLLASLIACYVPARRATRVDPAVTLRYE